MALPRNFFTASDEFDAKLIPLEVLFSMLGQTQAQELEQSPHVKNIQILCNAISGYVDSALNDFDSLAKELSGSNAAAALNQTVGILLVIGRELQNALQDFAEHVAHKECHVKDGASARADRAMEQLGEWVQRTTTLQSSEDVKRIQESYAKIATEHRAYEFEKSRRQPQPQMRSGGSSLDILSMLLGGMANRIPNDVVFQPSPADEARRAAEEAARQRAEEEEMEALRFVMSLEQMGLAPRSPSRSPSPVRSPSLSASSSSENLAGVARLFASPVRERAPDTVQPASPSIGRRP